MSESHYLASDVEWFYRKKVSTLEAELAEARRERDHYRDGLTRLAGRSIPYADLGHRCQWRNMAQAMQDSARAMLEKHLILEHGGSHE